MSRSLKSFAHLLRVLVTGYRPTSNWLSEHLLFSLQKHLKIYCRCIFQYLNKRKGHSSSRSSENKRPFGFSLCYWIKTLILSECVSSYQMQYYWHFDAIHNLLFLALFACWCETHMPRKVPEIKDFYEFTRCKQHTTSTCTVFGNKSTHAIFSTLYPLPWIISRSLARLVGLHAI